MQSEFYQWLSVVEIPALTGLFWMIWKLKNELGDFKIDIAHHYARLSDVTQLENRLTSHLLRIEVKLDVTALKTESLKARQ